MRTIEVGLGDSPMIIAKRITGDPRRYTELLAVNPVKSLVHVAGHPTFASLGVGEPLAVPDGWLGASYADELAAVGLHPDNPDAMYAALTQYLAGPQKYKEAQSVWHGARDNKSWFEQPAGTANLMWPFHSGKWFDNRPHTDAQLRAVFKIPAGVPTGQFLSHLWGFPAAFKYQVSSDDWSDRGGGINLNFNDAWNAVKSGVNAVGDVAATFHLPGANFTAALLTGADPIAALKKDANGFADSAAIAKGIVSGDPGPLIASAKAGLKHLTGVDPGNALDGPIAAAVAKKDPGAAMSAIFEEASKAGGAAGDPSTYANAWKVATHDGQLLSDLPAPPGLSYHPAAAPPTPANIAIHPAVVAANQPPIHLSLAHLTSVPAPQMPAAQPAPPAVIPPPGPPVTLPTPGPPAALPSPLLSPAYGPYPKQ